MTEAALHKSVAQYLALALGPHTWWTTFPLGGGGFVRGAKLKASGAKKGTPDVLIVHEGRARWIELKAAKGRVSPAQKETAHALINAGSDVFVARSLDDVTHALVVWAIPVKARAA
jgi:hypothetical protein